MIACKSCGVVYNKSVEQAADRDHCKLCDYEGPVTHIGDIGDIGVKSTWYEEVIINSNDVVYNVS